VTLKLAETSVLNSRPSVLYVADLLRFPYMTLEVLIKDWHGSCIIEICIGIKMTSMLFVSCWQWSTVTWSSICLAIQFWILLLSLYGT